jgi:hypothetical protein
MSKVPFRTWVAGETVTAAMLNQQIRDNGNAIWIGTTFGDMEYYFDSANKNRIPIGAAHQVLSVVGGQPAWAGPVAYQVFRNSAQSIPHATDTDITSFNVEQYDYNNFNAVPLTEITIPGGYDGLYMIHAQGFWEGHATAGKLREIGIKINGTARAKQSMTNDDATSAVWMNLSLPRNLVAGDKIRMSVLQRSGANLNFFEARLSVTRIR